MIKTNVGAANPQGGFASEESFISISAGPSVLVYENEYRNAIGVGVDLYLGTVNTHSESDRHRMSVMHASNTKTMANTQTDYYKEVLSEHPIPAALLRDHLLESMEESTSVRRIAELRKNSSCITSCKHDGRTFVAHASGQNHDILTLQSINSIGQSKLYSRTGTRASYDVQKTHNRFLKGTYRQGGAHLAAFHMQPGVGILRGLCVAGKGEETYTYIHITHMHIFIYLY